MHPQLHSASPEQGFREGGWGTRSTEEVLQVRKGQRDADAEMMLAAADALADAIRAGRLPRKPPEAVLARIAAIIATSRHERAVLKASR